MKIAICSDHAGVEYKAKLISYLLGNGMAMTLNHHKGIRAGLAWNTAIGKLVKEHNTANVLVMPARFISYQMAVSIVRAWPAGWRHL